MSDYFTCHSHSTQYGGEDHAARIIGTFNRCSEAVSDGKGTVLSLYLPIAEVGYIIGQALAMRREIDQLREIEQLRSGLEDTTTRSDADDDV